MKMKQTLLVLSICQKQNLWMTKSEKMLKKMPTKNPKTIAKTSSFPTLGYRS